MLLVCVSYLSRFAWTSNITNLPDSHILLLSIGITFTLKFANLIFSANFSSWLVGVVLSCDRTAFNCQPRLLFHVAVNACWLLVLYSAASGSLRNSIEAWRIISVEANDCKELLKDNLYRWRNYERGEKNWSVSNDNKQFISSLNNCTCLCRRFVNLPCETQELCSVC